MSQKEKPAPASARKSSLKSWFAEHWVEVFILVVCIGGLVQMNGKAFDLNREVGELSTKTDQLAKSVEQLGAVRDGVREIKADLTTSRAESSEIKTRVQDIEKSVIDIRLKLAEEAGKALWGESKKLRSFTQFGRFSDANKTSDTPLTYTWKLQQPVKADRVFFASVSSADPLPGLNFSAEISKDGTQCTMVVRGTAADSLEKLKGGTNGQVTIFGEPQ